MYKSAEELEISQAEYDAIIRVKDGLQAGNYIHVGEDFAYGDATGLDKGQKVFNMTIGFDSVGRSCGQVGCIGGWMGIELGLSPKDADSYVGEHDDHPTLGHLFYPEVPSPAWKVLDDKAAGFAIESWLKTGDGVRAWKEAVHDAHLRRNINKAMGEYYGQDYDAELED